MKRSIKPFAMGLATGVLIMGTTVAFAATEKTIQAVFGHVNVMMNGGQSDK